MVSISDLDETPRWRLALFLAILISHCVIVLFVVCAARQVTYSHNDLDTPSTVMYLPHLVSPAVPALSPASAARPSREPRSTHNRSKSEPRPDDAPPIENAPPTPPDVDWVHERELAIHNYALLAEKEKKYRNLSGLSPAQLSWIDQNHMKPVPPGLPWNHPRFELDPKSGLPMFWINDRCVLITLIVLCRF